MMTNTTPEAVRTIRQLLGADENGKIQQETYLIIAIDEQNNEYSIEIEAETMTAAANQFTDNHPESIIMQIGTASNSADWIHYGAFDREPEDEEEEGKTSEEWDEEEYNDHDDT